jgi:hypothetical protein
MSAMRAFAPRLGRAIGWVFAPIFGAVSFARRSRTFHPRGPTFHARVLTRDDVPPDLRPLSERLEGPALTRFSGALWKHAERLDVLGCAIRLRHDDRASALAARDDQDILFATILRPWTMPFAPFTTHARDYLGNDYWAVSPFDVGLERPVYLKLHPIRAWRHVGTTRTVRLVREVERGDAILSLEISYRPYGPWTPIAFVVLDAVAKLDGETLRFDPFHAGRGIHPHGFVQALRRGVYAASQLTRPRHATRRISGASRLRAASL